MNPAESELNKRLAQTGWIGRTVAATHLIDLKNSIEQARSELRLDETFSKECLDFFEFEPPPEMPHAKTVIIVAVPTPLMRIFCHWKGERVTIDIPPTYVDYLERFHSVENTLNSWLAAAGYQTAKPKLPLKTLAVRSGLAHRAIQL